MLINYVADGDLSSLNGKKIVLLHLDAPYVDRVSGVLPAKTVAKDLVDHEADQVAAPDGLDRSRLGEEHATWGDGRWERLGEAPTDDDGRVSGFGELGEGRYRLGFETGEHGNGFYPFVAVVFEIDGERPHYHIPLLLSPFGYTTYRGS